MKNLFKKETNIEIFNRMKVELSNGETGNQIKVGCVLPMVVASILLHAEFGPNDHREEAPHFNTDKYP